MVRFIVMTKWKKKRKKEAHHTIGILFHQYYLQSNFSFMRLYNLFAKRGEGLPFISIQQKKCDFFCGPGKMTNSYSFSGCLQLWNWAWLWTSWTCLTCSLGQRQTSCTSLCDCSWQDHFRPSSTFLKNYLRDMFLLIMMAKLRNISLWGVPCFFFLGEKWNKNWKPF